MIVPLARHTATRTATPQEGSCMAAHVRLNTEEFDKFCRLRSLTSGPEGTGKVSNAKVAEFLGLADNTVRRVRSGERSPGGDFIGSAVEAFRPFGIRFDDIFLIEADEPGENAA